MKKLISACVVLAAVVSIVGCSVKKIEYEKNEKGEVSYRIYENDHWLKTESTGIKGGMTGEGQFMFEAEGMKSSPSEEFNRTMQTYTTAFIQLAQIAAAAYNPASTSAINAKADAAARKAAAANAANAAAAGCADGSCTDTEAK